MTGATGRPGLSAFLPQARRVGDGDGNGSDGDGDGDGDGDDTDSAPDGADRERNG